MWIRKKLLKFLANNLILVKKINVINYLWSYRKFRKISPRAYIFQRPFWAASFWRGLCTQGNLRLKIDLPFFFVLLCIWRKFRSTSPPGGLYLEGRFNGGFFCNTSLGAYVWRGLYMEGLIFGILRYNNTRLSPNHIIYSDIIIIINNNNNNNNSNNNHNNKNKTLFIDLKKNRLFTDSRIWNIKIYTLCTFFLSTKENCCKMTIY